MTQSTDDTVRLIRQGMIDSEQQCRYYRYLAQRLRRRGEFLSIVIVSGSLGALFTILSPLPRWAPLSILGIVIGSVLVAAGMQFEKKTVFSGDLYRHMQKLSSEWSELYSDAGRRKDEELREAWRSLSERQRSALLYSPLELPQLYRLMRRCRNEAVEYLSPQPGVEPHEESTG